MATGYTVDFENKDVSFNEFVWTCARAFGPFVHLRDQDRKAKPELPKYDSYHEGAILDAKNNLRNMKIYLL